MGRYKPCRHKTADSHSERTHQYEAPADCRICKNTRRVGTFRNGRAATKQCACMDDRPRVEIRIWRCTSCGLAQKWDPSWGYFGNTECKECWVAQVDAVFCSPRCFDDLRAKHPRLRKLEALD